MPAHRLRSRRYTNPTCGSCPVRVLQGRDRGAYACFFLGKYHSHRNQGESLVGTGSKDFKNRGGK